MFILLCSPGKLLLLGILGIEGGGWRVHGKVVDAGIPCLHPEEYAAGAGLTPPSFFGPDVTVAYVFCE